MKRLLSLLALSLLLPPLLGAPGCAKNQKEPLAENPALVPLRNLLAAGDYDGALKAAKDITNRVPPQPPGEELLYLQAYILTYGRSDFQKARTPLKQLLDLYPNGAYGPAAEKLLADGYYWQGHYDAAEREYRKLRSNFEEKGYGSYAQLQEANCVLLDDKVADAMSLYRDVVEKYPTDPLASTAQLMIANSCLRLQNVRQAKTELRKLVALTKDEELQQSVQRALRQIEAEEPFHKGVEVPR